MKRVLSIMLAMVLCLPMVACEPDAGGGEKPEEEQPPAGPAYTFEKENTADKYSDKDGQLLATYSYSILRMRAAEDAPAEVQEKARTFNEMMDTVLENQLGSELREWAVYDERIKEDHTLYYTDELTVEYTEVGSYVSVAYSSYSYTGGAHPGSYCFSYLFDMDRGAFVDPSEIADDPELLRSTVTDLILDQINGIDQEIRDGLYENYPSIVAQWNNYCVKLGTGGMAITFPTYELGPYAMGALNFDIPYSSLSGVLGEGGRAKLLDSPAEQ